MPTSTPIDVAAELGIPPLETLLARSAGLKEYTFSYAVTQEPNGPNIISGKAYVKYTKVRQEMNIQGQRAVIIGDSRRELYHILFSDQKTAIRLDLAQVGNQAVNPSESMLKLTENSRLVGAEIVHGQQSAVFEILADKVSLRYWVWIERGLPLRIEASSDKGQAILNFREYKFGPQDDMLFELPPGTKIVEAPSSPPRLPDTGPALPTPSRTY